MIKTEKAHLNIEAASHPGMKGKENEDRYGVSAFLAGEKQGTPTVLAVLCDGIGGHRAGEVAAEMGVSIITETIAASDAQEPLETIKKAVHNANSAIYEASQEDHGRVGMGATCAVAWVIADRLYTTNLGDSRIYLLREGTIVQITSDHTWIQEALDAGIITNADRNDHPNAHVIRRYLGSKNSPELDFRLWYFADEGDDDALKNQGLLLEPGDIIMLCSDGLTDLVADKEIRDVILGSPLSKAPSALIEMANARGGHDNTTIVLLANPKQKAVKTAGRRKRQLLVGCLVMLVCAAVLITTIILGFRWWEGRMDAEETIQPGQTMTLPAADPTYLGSDTAVPTMIIEATAEPAGAQPSITPWPTHTSEP